MRIVVKLFRVRRVLIDEFNRHCKRPGHVLIVGIIPFVAIQLIVDGTNLQHLRLQGNADGDFESGIHFFILAFYPRAVRLEVVMGRS